MIRKLVFTLLMIAATCFLLISCANKTKDSQTITIPGEWYGNFDGKEMTIDDVRELAEKGDDLMFEDFHPYKGMNVSSALFKYLMVYGVEGGYRLIVDSSESTGKPGRANLESIWEPGGSGIDIRYNDVDEFIQANPSHPALTVDEMKTIAQTHLGREVTVIELEWWEYADEYPHHCKDPAKQALRESLDAIDGPLELFMDVDGNFIAINRKNGTLYVCDTATAENPVWNLYVDKNH